MKALYTAIFLMMVSALGAQQLPFLAFQKTNWNLLNPAALNSGFEMDESLFSASAAYRKQWLNLDDSPETFLLNSQFILEDYNIITGGHIIQDQTGKLAYTGLYGNFAYQIEFDGRDRQLLTIGLNIGAVQFRAKWAEIEFDEAEQVALSNEQVLRFDAGFGAYYYLENKFFAGISVPQSLGIDRRFQNNPTTFKLNRIPHAYLLLGGYLETDIIGKLVPSIWFRYVEGAPFSFDLNVRSYLSEYFWLGLGGDFAESFRTELGFALGENIGLYEGNLKFGLSFGIPLAEYRSAFGNSIELMTTFNW